MLTNPRLLRVLRTKSTVVVLITRVHSKNMPVCSWLSFV